MVIYLFGRFFLLMSGIKEVGVFEGCVFGVDVDILERMVFEVCEVIDMILGLVILFVEFEVIVCVFEFILFDCDWDVELRGL